MRKRTSVTAWVFRRHAHPPKNRRRGLGRPVGRPPRGSRGRPGDRHERREAAREIASADSRWEVRHEIREAHREINHERREAPAREVQREVNQSYWRW